MNKIRLVILSLILVILSGCTVKYEIDIDSSKISEKAIIDVTGIEIPYKNDLNLSYNAKFGLKYDYEFKDNDLLISNDNSNINNFSSNEVYIECFDQIESFEKDNKYYLATSPGFKCMSYEQIEVDNVEVVVKTFNKVEEHNADKVGFGTYTWYINKDNYKDKNLYIVVDKDTYKWFYNFKDLIIEISLLIIVMVVSYIIYKHFKVKSNKVNKL